MDIKRETTREGRLTGILAQAYTLLALAPCDAQGRRPTPGDMAAYVVEAAKRRGDLGFLFGMFDVWEERA